jgi:hypothetical protein
MFTPWLPGCHLTIDLNPDIVSILSKCSRDRCGFITDPSQMAHQGLEKRQAELA